MWQIIANLIGGPVVSGLIKAYQAKLTSDNAAEKIAADLAMRELAVQEAETQARAQLKVAEIGHPFEPEKLFAYVTLFFYAKVLIWDAALHLGSTDAVKGSVGDWAALVMAFYFGQRTFQNVARIIKR